MRNSLDASAPVDILFEYLIEHVSFRLLSAMFTLPTRPCYGEYKALQLIVLAACGAMDKPFASCMLVHYLEI